jgi:hypothetical protein
MNQKTYRFPKIGGGEVEKTLATPTNRRMVKALGIFGIKSFSEMMTGMVEVAVKKLDIIGDEKLREALDVVLVEGSSDIDLHELDLRISDGAVQDFFDQRSIALQERQSA